jgi:inner membrane protein COX18
MIGLARSSRILRSTTQNFSALPSAYRLSLYQQSLQRATHHSQRRAFSATPSRKLDLYESVVSVPATILDAIHSTGLPWFATIPVAAVLVRGVLIYYTCTKPAHLDGNKISHLNPLISARASSKLRAIPRPAGNAHLAEKALFISTDLLNRWRILKHIKTRFGIPQTWKTLVPTYLSLIVMAEAIRLRCGASGGLLETLLSPFNVFWRVLKGYLSFLRWYFTPPTEEETEAVRGSIEKWTGVQTPSTSSSPAGEGMRKFIEKWIGTRNPSTSSSPAADAVGALPSKAIDQPAVSATSPAASASSPAADITSPAASATSAAPSASSPAADITSSSSVATTTSTAQEPIETLSHLDLSSLADPSLALEGLFFCPDLSLPDPTWCLPILLFTTLITPTILRLKTSLLTEQEPPDVSKLRSSEAQSFMKEYHAGAEERRLLAEKQAKTLLRGSMFSLAFAILLSDLPAGILLYVIANQTTAMVQRLWLQYKFPRGETIRPCKRPMRIRVRNRYGTARPQ